MFIPSILISYRKPKIPEMNLSSISQDRQRKVCETGKKRTSFTIRK